MITTTRYTPELIRVVLRRISNGELLHRIAADLGVNQGRISEIKNNAPWVAKILKEHDENPSH